MIKLTATAGAAGMAALIVPSRAAAEGALHGTFWVYCEQCKNVDKVEGITRNHDCETNGCDGKPVAGGTAYVVCPNGHWKKNKVQDITRQHECGTCGEQCEGNKKRPKKPED